MIPLPVPSDSPQKEEEYQQDIAEAQGEITPVAAYTEKPGRDGSEKYCQKRGSRSEEVFYQLIKNGWN